MKSGIIITKAWIFNGLPETKEPVSGATVQLPKIKARVEILWKRLPKVRGCDQETVAALHQLFNERLRAQEIEYAYKVMLYGQTMSSNRLLTDDECGDGLESVGGLAGNREAAFEQSKNELLEQIRARAPLIDTLDDVLDLYLEEICSLYEEARQYIENEIVLAQIMAFSRVLEM